MIYWFVLFSYDAMFQCYVSILHTIYFVTSFQDSPGICVKISSDHKNHSRTTNWDFRKRWRDVIALHTGNSYGYKSRGRVINYRECRLEGSSFLFWRTMFYFIAWKVSKTNYKAIIFGFFLLLFRNKFRFNNWCIRNAFLKILAGEYSYSGIGLSFSRRICCIIFFFYNLD